MVSNESMYPHTQRQADLAEIPDFLCKTRSALTDSLLSHAPPSHLASSDKAGEGSELVAAFPSQILTSS